MSVKVKRNDHSKPESELPGRKILFKNQSRSFVVYGRSGSGKTTLASTFPKPLLLLDVNDKGVDSIADVEDITIRGIDTFEEFELMYEYLVINPKAFKTVVIDTCSQLQQLVIKEVLAENKKSTKRAGDWGTMTKRDWGDVAALLKEWFVNYRDLTDIGINVVFIAQDRVFNISSEEDEAAGEIDPEVGPGLMPSVAKVLNAAVSAIGNTFIRERSYKKEVRGKKVSKNEIQYCLRIGPNPVYVTKLRKPKTIAVPSFISDPSYEDIVSIIKGEE